MYFMSLSVIGERNRVIPSMLGVGVLMKNCTSSFDSVSFNVLPRIRIWDVLEMNSMKEGGDTFSIPSSIIFEIESENENENENGEMMQITS